MINSELPLSLLWKQRGVVLNVLKWDFKVHLILH